MRSGSGGGTAGNIRAPTPRRPSLSAPAPCVELAGDVSYFGRLHHKPVIGDALRPITAQDIDRACRLMLATGILSLLLLGAVRALFSV